MHLTLVSEVSTRCQCFSSKFPGFGCSHSPACFHSVRKVKNNELSHFPQVWIITAAVPDKNGWTCWHKNTRNMWQGKRQGICVTFHFDFYFLCRVPYHNKVISGHFTCRAGLHHAEYREHTRMVQQLVEVTITDNGSTTSVVIVAVMEWRSTKTLGEKIPN